MQAAGGGADRPPPDAGAPDVVPWGPDRLSDVVALTDAALPDDHLSADELLGCLWEDPDPGIVLATADGSGVVAVVRRSWGEEPDVVALAYVKVIAVHPDHRRSGAGRRLLRAAESWAWDVGAAQLLIGGSAPWYLWPGVDATATGATCLLEAAGYRPAGTEVDMALRSTFRADPPAGVEVRRAVTDADVADVRALVARVWPNWVDELDRAVEAACVLAAFDGDGRAVGFCCHSVNRTGFLGPMGTDPERQGRGVGAALVSAVCRDLMIADVAEVQIAWVGPVRFYAKLGATISRVYRTWRLPPPAR